MQDAIAQETIHDTLAQEWRHRMASRGAMAAVLLAVPILVAAAIGFSAGGGLPFGISSFASGPGDSSSSTDKAGHGSDSISRLIGSSASAATVSPVTAGGGNGSAGGNGDATRGSGGGSAGGGGGGSHGTTVTGTTGSTGSSSSGGGSSTGNGGGNNITVPNPVNPSSPGPNIQVPDLPVSPPSVPNPGGGNNPLGGVTGNLPGGTSGQSSSGGNPLSGVGDAVGVHLP
jgi:hypothetical protein